MTNTRVQPQNFNGSNHAKVSGLFLLKFHSEKGFKDVN
jgi:hypothetical protein